MEGKCPNPKYSAWKTNVLLSYLPEPLSHMYFKMYGCLKLQLSIFMLRRHRV
jgi:hypothetical protein